MNQQVKQHYKDLFEKYGRDHNAVQYSSKESQVARFNILLDIADDMTSVADIGCGLGDILPTLRQRHPDAAYHGYDFVEEFVIDANDRFGEDNNAWFKQLDIVSDDIPEETDYVLLSGIFNNLFDDNESFTELTLTKMWAAARKGIAFNALSNYVDYQDNGLYYQSPEKLFEFCKSNLSKYVTLRHDYTIKENSMPFEFSMYVYKK